MKRIFFHRTTEAAARTILADGFQDGTGLYLTAMWHSGVWLSDVPLDSNEGASGEELLAVTMDIRDAEADEYEWVEEFKGYREWLFPADLLNGRATTTCVTHLEGDSDFDPRWRKNHADFGNPDCCGYIFPVNRSEEADIACNECGAILRTVRLADVRRTLDDMESQLPVASAICQHCGAVNLLRGFTRPRAFICHECGKGNARQESS